MVAFAGAVETPKLVAVTEQGLSGSSGTIAEAAEETVTSKKAELGFRCE